MSNITIHQLEPDITKLLEQRAAAHGNTIEVEIKAILKSVLVPEANLVEAIEKHFVHLDKFELPEIPREPMREPPSFEISEV